MATLAFAPIGTLRELSLVLILVAIGANIMRNSRFEIAILMAAHAGHIRMLALQRKLRLRVVELGGEARLLPRRRCVTGIAAWLERAFVRIAMAVRAVCELEPRVARLTVSPRRVATLAQHIAVFAGKRKLRLRMIEFLPIDRRAFPSRRRVASRAISAKAALVLIFVAIRASGCQAKPGAIQVLVCKYRASLLRNVLRSMASSAANTNVLAV